MKKVAILYICTGKYNVFWKPFYESFERFFLPMCEKHYFVFCDEQTLFDEESNNRIHRFKMEHLPWPLPTLLRFWEFSRIRDELLQCDYVCLMNANVVCKDYVYEEDYLPRADSGEELFFTIHPGYEKVRIEYCPYERRKESNAYVAYSQGKQYVFGAMNGGTAKAYVSMIEELNQLCMDDLKKGIIAKWHDESYINYYVTNHDHYRLLPISYCYPQGWENSAECKILGLDKSNFINVDLVKGIDRVIHQSYFLHKFNSMILRVKSKCKPKLYRLLGW